LSPARRRAGVEHVVATLGVSERFACRVIGQHRATQRLVAKTADDEAALTADIIELARQYGRYGYRRITALLHQAGWAVNKKRVARIWRREGLKVPQRQPKRARLWLNEASCIRLRAERPNHVWYYDFVEDRTHDGRKIHMLYHATKPVGEWHIESFNARLRDEFLNGEIFYTLQETRVLIEAWRR